MNALREFSDVLCTAFKITDCVTQKQEQIMAKAVRRCTPVKRIVINHYFIHGGKEHFTKMHCVLITSL